MKNIFNTYLLSLVVQCIRLLLSVCCIKIDELNIWKDIWFGFHQRDLRKSCQRLLVFYLLTLMPLKNTDLLQRCGAAVLKVCDHVETTLRECYVWKQHLKGLAIVSSCTSSFVSVHVCETRKCFSFWLPWEEDPAAGLTPSRPHCKTHEALGPPFFCPGSCF